MELQDTQSHPPRLAPSTAPVNSRETSSSGGATEKTRRLTNVQDVIAPIEMMDEYTVLSASGK